MQRDAWWNAEVRSKWIGKKCILENELCKIEGNAIYYRNREKTLFAKNFIKRGRKQETKRIEMDSFGSEWKGLTKTPPAERMELRIKVMKYFRWNWSEWISGRWILEMCWGTVRDWTETNANNGSAHEKGWKGSHPSQKNVENGRERSKWC